MQTPTEPIPTPIADLPTSPQPAPDRFYIDAQGLTDAGCMREHNEDHFLVAELQREVSLLSASFDRRERAPGTNSEGLLLGVADGLGGHGDGARASAIALRTILRTALGELPFRLPAPDPKAGGTLRALVSSAEQQILAAGPSDRGRLPGTTLTVAFVRWPEVHLLHVGDSRAYVVRAGRARRLTRDHTLAQKVREEGGQHVAASSPLDDILVNALGGDRQPAVPELASFRLERGDTLLLCSDGLTHHLSDPEIVRTAEAATTAGECCARLIEGVRRRGGEDNVTAVTAFLR